MRLGPLSATASDALLASISEGRLQQTRNNGSPTQPAATLSSSSSSWRTSARATPRTSFRPRSMPCSPRGSTGSTRSQRSMLALGAVVGRQVQTAAVHALADRCRVPRSSRPATDSSSATCSSRRPARKSSAPLSARPHPRRRLRVAGEVGACAASPATPPGWQSGKPAGRRRREDRPPPRDGLPLRGGDRWPGPRRVSPRGRDAARGGGESGARTRRPPGGDRLSRAFPRRCSATSGKEGVELLPALVSALFEAGSFDRAEEVAERAVAASASVGLPRVQARAAVERERISSRATPRRSTSRPRSRSPRRPHGRCATWRRPWSGAHGVPDVRSRLASGRCRGQLRPRRADARACPSRR